MNDEFSMKVRHYHQSNKIQPDSMDSIHPTWNWLWSCSRSCFSNPRIPEQNKVFVEVLYLHHYMKATAKANISFLGLLNHASDMVPFDRLHLHPLQYYPMFFQALLGGRTQRIIKAKLSLLREVFKQIQYVFQVSKLTFSQHVSITIFQNMWIHSQMTKHGKQMPS